MLLSGSPVVAFHSVTLTPFAFDCFPVLKVDTLYGLMGLNRIHMINKAGLSHPVPHLEQLAMTPSCTLRQLTAWPASMSRAREQVGRDQARMRPERLPE